MFYTYLWQSSGLSIQEAYERFESVLSDQCGLYKMAFGQELQLKIKRVGDIFIGQLQGETGIAGWDPWIDNDKTGLVWNGVCEDYLGKRPDIMETSNIIDVLDKNPEKLLEWNGMFSVTAWDAVKKKVTLTTAATECPTLWYVEGPFGWVSGPRAVPALEIAGCRMEPSIDAIRLYLSYGYFMGGHCPFQNVYRLRDRQQVFLSSGAKPRITTYAPLASYMKTDGNQRDWKENVSFAAERIAGSVRKEIMHSQGPVVLLTGGHDSRCLAAAAKKSGLFFKTATGGPLDSEDVIVASKVAAALNVQHRLDGEVADIGLLRDSLERLKLWVRMTEGIVPLSFCLHMKGFLSSQIPFPALREQFVHGLEPGIGRGSFYPDVEAAQLKSMRLDEAHGFMTYRNPLLKWSERAESMLRESFGRLDDILVELDGKVYHWFELFLWLERGLIWGMDLQSAYGLARWAWTPLFDRELMRLSWDLTVEQKKSGHFLEDVYTYLVPALERIYCIKYTGMKKRSLASRIKNRAFFELGRYLYGAGIKSRLTDKHKENAAWSKFWETALLGNGSDFWKEFIDEKNIRKIINLSGQDLLWRLLTVNFLAEEFFGAYGKNGGSNA